MRLVAVDIGNSSSKFALASNCGNEIEYSTSIVNENGLGAKQFEWLSPSETCLWVVCSVHADRAAELQRWVGLNRTQDQYHLIQPEDIPLPSDVESRPLLGRDRLIAAWQARLMYPSGPLVVIDAGTAVTVDLVRSDSVFAGGVIFPGARTMLRILAKQTAALPDLSGVGISGAFDDIRVLETFPAFGRSTRHAILTGIYQTQLSALQNIVATHRSQLSEPLVVVATGGGYAELQPWLPAEWVFDPFLVLKGAISVGQILLAG